MEYVSEERTASAGADRRAARLALSLSGTNLARAGDYNQRIVLQAIRLSGETTRLELANTTGLTAPTIANITGRLMELGFVRLAGRRQGSRGQPALRLVVDADGCFGIGLNIDRDHIAMVTLDLAGEVRSRVQCEVAFAGPEAVARYVARELDALIAAGGVDRDRVLGVGVALPDDLGRVALAHQPADYAAWADTDVPALLRDVLPWPIHVDNDAAAAALGEAQCGTGYDHPSFFYLLLSWGLGGGLVIDRSYYRGAGLRSGEIWMMPDASAGRAGAIVQDTVSVSALAGRLEAAGRGYAGIEDLEAPGIEDVPEVAAWLDDAARSLTDPLVAVNCLINPDAVLIGGRLPMKLIEGLTERVNRRLAAVEMPARAPVLAAAMARDAPAIGAAILPFLDHVLPSDAILIQAGRGR